MADQTSIKALQKKLARCAKCQNMIGPVVICKPVMSKILLIGQAPGDKEGVLGRPFAWTAGKTLFKWFGSIGLDEESFRNRVYMSAVCRCFPGKNPKGGDRVPDKNEIKNCAKWYQTEIELLEPDLMLLVGKLAISQFIEVNKLVDVIGRIHTFTHKKKVIDLIPLPHPSGASTWHRMEPGKTLLNETLQLLARHSAWKTILD